MSDDLQPWQWPEEHWRAIVNRVRPEVVYHLAGWSDVGGSWAAPVEVLIA